jgi:hypothetical protein
MLGPFSVFAAISMAIFFRWMSYECSGEGHAQVSTIFHPANHILTTFIFHLLVHMRQKKKIT